MKHIFRFSVLAMFAVVMTVVTSCSSSKDPVEVIPADVDLAGVMNFKQFVSATGTEITADDIELPQELIEIAGEDIPNQAKDIICTAWSALDLEKMVFFGYFSENRQQFFVTVKVNDNDKLETLLTDAELDKAEENGFDIYSQGKYTAVAVKDDLAWMVYDSKDRKNDDITDAIEKIIDKADDNKFVEEKSALGNYITKGDVLNVAYSSDFILKAVKKELESDSDTRMIASMLNVLNGYWTCLSANLTEKDASLSIEFINSAGEKLTNPYSAPMSEEFLSYVPSDFNLAFAAGISPKLISTLEGLYKNLGSNLDSESRMIADTLLPYLKSIDGTISFAVGYNDLPALFTGNFNPAGVRVIAMVEMSGNKADEAVTEIGNLIQQQLAANPYMQSNITIEPGRITIGVPSDSTVVSIRSTGGNLILSNTDIQGGRTNSFSGMFKGHDAEMAASFTDLSSITDGQCPYGFSLAITLDADKLSARFATVGTNSPLVVAIAKFGMAFQRFQRSYYDRMYSYGNYGYDYNYAVADTLAYEEAPVAEIYDYSYDY